MFGGLKARSRQGEAYVLPDANDAAGRGAASRAEATRLDTGSPFEAGKRVFRRPRGVTSQDLGFLSEEGISGGGDNVGLECRPRVGVDGVESPEAKLTVNGITRSQGIVDDVWLAGLDDFASQAFPGSAGGATTDGLAAAQQSRGARRSV